jgi:hypothetical protein
MFLQISSMPGLIEHSWILWKTPLHASESENENNYNGVMKIM